MDPWIRGAMGIGTLWKLFALYTIHNACPYYVLFYLTPSKDDRCSASWLPWDPGLYRAAAEGTCSQGIW